MQFNLTKRQKLSESIGDSGSPYPFWINFYTTIPDYKVSLQEIEELVTERLKILQVIDNLLKSFDPSNIKHFKDLYDVMISQINSVKNTTDKNFYVAGRNESNPKFLEARKRDHISHFLLRIYYCQSEELRRWFISREAELFKIRCIDSSLTNTSLLEKSLAYYGFDYEIVSTANNINLHNKVNWSEYNKNNISSIAFKLNFEDAIDLIRTRKVFVHKGHAYIASNEMISVICNRFKSNLSRELTKMHMDFDSFAEQRLLCRLESLHQCYIGNKDKKANSNSDGSTKERINPDDIDQLAKDLFPPCMRSIHETLRKEHHLKHYGRLHYGLFLKNVGLRLEDAIEFFRSEFSIKNPDKFQKEYAYTIRYIYGKEGKRVQLSPYSCQKIINGNAPGPNDTHGCPFRHYDTKNLKALLVRYGINQETELDEIIDKITTEKNYGGACSKFFSFKCQQQLPENYSIFHPNQFYNDARRVLYGLQSLQLKSQQNESKDAANDENNIPMDESLDEDMMSMDQTTISGQNPENAS